MSNETVRKRSGQLIALGAALATLAVSPFASLDPINLIKIVFLSAIAFSLLPMTMMLYSETKYLQEKILIFTALSFVFWLTLVLLTSDAPLSQQFWGVFGRNTGYLTYFALLAFLVAAALVQRLETYVLLVRTLILTSLPVLAYAIIQSLGMDPISWSQLAPFGTLGNINFSSAFFGMSAIAMTVVAISPGKSLILRICLSILVITKLLVVASTGSIQGLMIYVAGVAVILFFFVTSNNKLKFLKMPYLVLGIVGFATSIAGLLNQGPLARFIFGETVLFRYDYWYAGWMMSLRNPLFGVGLDSYGDWYRELRGEVATLRTVPDRITNSAHNIYLDISSGGGIPLLSLYFIFLALALRAILRHLRHQKSFDPTFTALASVWFAYQIQAAISINQVGVGVWGWAFTGALIGYEKSKLVRNGKDRIKSQPKYSRGDQLPLKAALLSIMGFIIGAALAFVPYQADVRFRDAQEAGSISEMARASKSLGSTAYHRELALDAAIQSNDVAQAREIVDDLIATFPRNFMAWRVQQVLVDSTPQEREAAFLSLKEFDPFNPEIVQVK